MDTQNNEALSICKEPVPQSAGALLCATRIAQNMTIEEAAAKTYLMPCHIIVLEADAYNPELESKRPASGLAAYARLLGLNVREIQRLFEQNTERESLVSEASPW